MFDVTFLGTGGSIPTKGRNLPAIAVQHKGWVLLLDAGEDVQRQLETANIGLNKRMRIFITHIHADHLIGLPGLLLRFSLLGRQRPLKIFGPSGLVEYIRVNQKTIHLGTTFETTVYGVEEGVLFEDNGLSVRAFEVDHRGKAFGFDIRYQRATGTFLPDKARELGVPEGPQWKSLSDGQSVKLDDGTVIQPEQVTEAKPAPVKIVYSGDTRPCENLREAARNANLLISEAMYAEEHRDLAEERGHMTAIQAAEIARDANVGLLVLTHYSPRYETEMGEPILAEAREVFGNSILARDLMQIRVEQDETKVEG